MQHASMPTVNLTMTGANIRAIRKQRGLSVRDLQDIFGFATPQAIYKWQQGVTLPTVDNLVVLASIFGVPMEKILVIEAEQ
ncbi:MAG: helix-turn-helix domain-containing protein [Aristaeellaceae bacterium]